MTYLKKTKRPTTIKTSSSTATIPAHLTPAPEAEDGPSDRL